MLFPIPVIQVVKNVQCMAHIMEIQLSLLTKTVREELMSLFYSRQHLSHHKSLEHNIIENFQFPMVSGFIIDNMHTCYLGVMRRILKNRLLNVKVRNRKVRLGKDQKIVFHERLLKYQKCIPSEFNQKLEGGIDCVLKYKASQLRLLALYVGILLIKSRKLVPLKFHSNFLHLSLA